MLELIKKITVTEEIAQQLKIDCQMAAKQMISEANKEGEEKVKKRRQEAQNASIKILQEAKDTVDKNRQNANIISQEICKKIEDDAHKSLDNAVKLLVERVVTSA